MNKTSNFLATVKENEYTRIYGDPVEYTSDRQSKLPNCTQSQCSKAKVELLISKWHINHIGQLFKFEEKQFKNHTHHDNIDKRR